MKVLVVGSLPAGEDPVANELYRRACRDIGMEMAQRDWTIGVGTDRPNSADLLIVEGARKSGRAIDIKVYFHDKERLPFPDDKGFHHEHGPGTWVAGRHKQIVESDVVLLMGGGDKTAPAFHQAKDLHKPCLPVPGFGGASEEVWDIFVANIESLRLNPEGNLRSKLQPWREGKSASVLLDFVEHYVRSKPYSARRSPYLAIILAILACATLAWAFLFFGQSTAGRYTLFGVLVASSIMGTTLHWLWNRLKQDDAQESFDSFVVRAGVAVVEAFALFLFLLVGAISIDGNVSFLDSLSNETDFLRLAAIVSLFGLAAGFMTEEITKSLEGRLASIGKDSTNNREGTGKT